MRNLIGRFVARRKRLLGRLVFYGMVLFLGIPFALSHVMIKAYPGQACPAPAGFEETYIASEGLRLRTWTVRGDAAHAAVVVAHGLGDSVESYLDLARTLHQRGHTVSLIVLHGHGGSQTAACTLGGRERADVQAGISHLLERRLAPHGLVLLGVSMGSVAVLRAAASRNDLAAVIVEAPYDTYRETIAHHAKLLYGLPRWAPIIPVAIAFSEWRAGFDASEVDAVDAARHIQAPLLAIVDGDDPRMPEPVVRRVFDAHPGPKTLWVAPGAGHAGAQFAPGYWPTVLGFLAQHGL